MPISIDISADIRRLRALRSPQAERAIVRALKKAGSTALRDMRSEASKRVRRRKRLRVRTVKKALSVSRARGSKIEDLKWTLKVSGKPVPLSAYPHRQTKKGVSVTVNRGKRTVIGSAFVASLTSGHKGVFLRRGRRRLPITELLGSRPVDALSHDGEAEGVSTRGRRSLVSTFDRLLGVELEKV